MDTEKVLEKTNMSNLSRNKKKLIEKQKSLCKQHLEIAKTKSTV